MSISSVGSSYVGLQTQAAARAAETAEVQKVGRDNDGDSDDGGGKAAQAAAAPSVNLNGQTVGQLINVSA